MNKEEKELVEGIKQYPTHRELCLIHVIERLDEELNNRIPKERINEQIRFLNDEGYFEFNTKRDLEKATKILNNLLNKE